MENREALLFALQELRKDDTRKQQRGLHFIIASVFLWAGILVIHASSLPISTKNLYTFFSSASLVPIAYLISKLIGVYFQNKDNPLSRLGILFALNQMLYILIAMWVYAAIPEKMLMVYAMIFGAHLLPYGWLYQCKIYYVLSVFIPIAVLVVGIYCSSVVVAALMLLVEIVFCICLIIENKGGKL